MSEVKETTGFNGLVRPGASEINIVFQLEDRLGYFSLQASSPEIAALINQDKMLVGNALDVRKLESFSNADWPDEPTYYSADDFLEFARMNLNTAMQVAIESYNEIVQDTADTPFLEQPDTLKSIGGLNDAADIRQWEGVRNHLKSVVDHAHLYGMNNEQVESAISIISDLETFGGIAFSLDKTASEINLSTQFFDPISLDQFKFETVDVGGGVPLSPAQK